VLPGVQNAPRTLPAARFEQARCARGRMLGSRSPADSPPDSLIVTPSPEIRALQGPDLRALLALYELLHADDAPLPPEAELLPIWYGLLADPLHIYLGAFVSGRLLSACNAAIIPNLTRGARPYAVIENVVTHRDHRGQGLARATLRALVAECHRHDCYKISLTSAAQRSAAHGLYESLGFDPDAKRAFVLKA
jgi:GNAT superfamily N-acetyltransferase